MDDNRTSSSTDSTFNTSSSNSGCNNITTSTRGDHSESCSVRFDGPPCCVPELVPIVWMATATIVTTIGNMAICWVIHFTPSLQTTHNMFVLNLAWCDLLMGAINSVRIVKNELGGSVTQRVSRGPERLGGSQWWDQRNWGVEPPQPPHQFEHWPSMDRKRSWHSTTGIGYLEASCAS